MTMTRSPNPQKFSKSGRRNASVKFVMTERDTEILRALGEYRYLRTGQISRLIFPNNNTVQSARRRLKYLYHAGYIGRIQPMEDQPLGATELAYFLEKAGRELLDDDSLPNFSLKQHVKPLFLRHALQVSEFRLQWTQATEAEQNIYLHRVIMDSELKQHTEGLIGKKRYRLFDELHDPIGKRKLVVHPDLLLIMRAELPSGKESKRLFLVEIDRGTEGLRVIADKLTGYHLYRRERVFKKFGSFDNFRVLIQTTSEKRAQNIASIAKDFSEVLDVWVVENNRASAKSVLRKPIWINSKNSPKKKILK
ncbi:MAG: replication-relaxation family protein [Pseudomonadota bacterium]